MRFLVQRERLHPDLRRWGHLRFLLYGWLVRADVRHLDLRCELYRRCLHLNRKHRPGALAADIAARGTPSKNENAARRGRQGRRWRSKKSSIGWLRPYQL